MIEKCSMKVPLGCDWVACSKVYQLRPRKHDLVCVFFAIFLRLEHNLKRYVVCSDLNFNIEHSDLKQSQIVRSNDNYKVNFRVQL